MLRVLIVASSPVVRRGLRHLVESADVRIIGEEESLSAVESAGRTRAGEIDVFLLGEGRLLDEWPEGADERQAAIVVLAGPEPHELVSELLVLDLRGWAVLPGDAEGDEVRAALVAADAGLALMPARAIPQAMQGMTANTPPRLHEEGVPRPSGRAGTQARVGRPGSRPGRRSVAGALRADDEDDHGAVFGESLTPREREVLELLGHGHSNRGIAARLGISEHTAKFHVASVLAKLGASNRADAVRRGLRRGLVTL